MGRILIELPEDEKESDRAEALKILEIITQCNVTKTLKEKDDGD